MCINQERHTTVKKKTTPKSEKSKLMKVFFFLHFHHSPRGSLRSLIHSHLGMLAPPSEDSVSSRSLKFPTRFSIWPVDEARESTWSILGISSEGGCICLQLKGKNSATLPHKTKREAV